MKIQYGVLVLERDAYRESSVSDKHNRDLALYTKVLAWVTCGMLAATIASLAENGYQLLLTKGAVSAAQSQANIARKQFDLSSQQLRAIIGTEILRVDITNNQNARPVIISIKNSGPTIASNVKFDGNVRIFHLDKSNITALLKIRGININNVALPDIGPNASETIPISDIRQWSKEDIDKFMNEYIAIQAFGKISYDDIFNHSYEKDFCYLIKFDKLSRYLLYDACFSESKPQTSK